MDLVFRTAAVFAVVYFITRLVGRRELNSLEPFDLILLVVLGDLIQQGVTQNDNSVTGIVVVMGTLVLCVSFLEWVTWRFPRVRSKVDGEPVVLIEYGRTIERNMRRERLTVSELEAEARLQQISTLEEVRLAVLETNGQISFIESSK
jgi:uncharacterized membrane protein YcaP (DUF421 family)